MRMAKFIPVCYIASYFILGAKAARTGQLACQGVFLHAILKCRLWLYEDRHHEIKCLTLLQSSGHQSAK